MICNDDRLLPVARTGSSAASFLACSGGSRDKVPKYLGYSLTEGAEKSATISNILDYGQDELTTALKLSPQVLRYDPAWKLKCPFKPRQSEASITVKSRPKSLTLNPSTESGRKMPKVYPMSVSSLDAQKSRALSSQVAAKGAASGANAQPKSHRVTRPTLAAMHHRRQSPQAVMDLISKNPWTVDIFEKEEAEQSRNKNKPIELNELQYLVAYNLVNNFYFNLVSWSPTKQAIAIAIDSKAYWWNGSGMVEDIRALRVGAQPISCISCSPQGHFAVASLDGLLSVHSVKQPFSYLTRAFPSPVFTMEWFPNGKYLLVGDAHGKIAIMQFVEGETLDVVSHLSGLNQQICGFALNATCTEVAAGANENLALVWDISNLKRPLLKCRLLHKSAVKGISFCPWAPGLLATGGGSNDRHLRYWHTGSGQLLGEIDTMRQITSIFWSSQVKQILVTYGYSTCTDNVVAAVYPYPGKKPVAEARSRDPLRALSASVAPDESSVAVAANDGTVRVYSLWPKRNLALTHAAASGSYGSSIIETAECVEIRPVFR